MEGTVIARQSQISGKSVQIVIGSTRGVGFHIANLTLVLTERVALLLN